MRLAFLLLLALGIAGCLRPACITGDCSSYFQGVHEIRASSGWDAQKAQGAFDATNATVDAALGPGMSAHWTDGVQATILATDRGDFTLDLEHVARVSLNGGGELRAEADARAAAACDLWAPVFAMHAEAFANASGWHFALTPCAGIIAVT